MFWIRKENWISKRKEICVTRHRFINPKKPQSLSDIYFSTKMLRRMIQLTASITEAFDWSLNQGCLLQSTFKNSLIVADVKLIMSFQLCNHTLKRLPIYSSMVKDVLYLIFNQLSYAIFLFPFLPPRRGGRHCFAFNRSVQNIKHSQLVTNKKIRAKCNSEFWFLTTLLISKD